MRSRRSSTLNGVRPEHGVRSGSREPFHTGERVRLPVDGLSHEGDGVARSNGFVFFIPDAAPGDVVDAEVTEVKRRHGRARLVNVVKPGEARIQPMCRLVGECGGCQVQHLSYASQLLWKEQQVRDAMDRIGKLPHVPIRPILGMEHPFHYRNKAQYPVGIEHGRVVLGFFRRGTHRIVDVDDCLVQHPLSVKVAEAARRAISELHLTPHDERRGTGLMRHLVVRVSFSRREVMAIFVVNGREIPHQEQLISRLHQAVPELVSIVLNMNTERTNVILGKETRVLWGEPFLVDRLCGLEFEISPRSFFQVNPVQAEVLYRKAMEYAGIGSGAGGSRAGNGATAEGAWAGVGVNAGVGTNADIGVNTEVRIPPQVAGKKPIGTIWDVYCGAGTIGLSMAPYCERVVGVETVPEAVDDARRNAERDGLRNAEFKVGRAEDLLPAAAARGERADVVVVDPPRSGCELSVLQAIADFGPSRIVYVSCNPASLARDLAWLANVGYSTVEVQPVDMFPHTSHVECCALVVRDTK